ncbi:MAG: hypothetical protein ACR2P1_22835 [Pseudomonadales bacterium]
MHLRVGFRFLAVFVLSATPALAANADAPSIEKMWEVIQQQAKEIEQLKAAAAQRDQRIQVTDLKVEATADAVEQSVSNTATSREQQTSIGGYGELHYNNLDDESGREGADDVDEIDLHRYVLFFGHQFTDTVRFYSELEVEHGVAGDGQNGEVELEQAFIEWDYAANQRAKTGVFLVPVGILNETHEPDTFYGVERNRVEAEIIPATWWEAGVAFSGELGVGFSYDVGVHSGLFLDETARLRSGRQKVSEAKSDDPAYTARLKYTGVRGLELAATVQYQTDLFQGETFAGESSIDAMLYEVHAAYQSGPFQLRALYANWNIDEGINAVSDRDDADQREGFYIEPGFKISEQLGLFLRYSEWDEVRADASADMSMSEVMLGANFWLTETVVLKADYQDQEGVDGRAELDGFNLGVGWSF